MIFLTDLEIPSYTTVPGVSSQQIRLASKLIESYLGKSLDVSSATQTFTPNKKNKGRFDNTPVTSITSGVVTARTPVGISETPIDVVNEILLDDYGYFEYYPIPTFFNDVFGSIPNRIKLSYTYGYESPPEQLKEACGILADTIKKRGMGGEKEISDITEMRIVLTDDSVFTSDVRLLCSKYREI